MRLLLEDPEFDVFDLDNYDLKDLIKEEYTLLNISRAMIMDMSGVEYYDPNDDTIIEDEEIFSSHDVRFQYSIMAIPSLHPHILEIVYSQSIKRFQVLFKIYKDRIIKPCEIRVNKDMKGRLLGACEIELSETMKPKRLYNIVFIPEKKDNKHSYIVGIFDKSREIVFLQCSLKLKDKEYGNYLDLLIPYTHLTEKQFLEHAKKRGLPVSSKSLRNYRSKSHQSIFPMPYICKDPVTGVIKKYYDKSWVKYLKRINELKEILRNNQDLYLKYDIKRLRDLDKHLGCDSFKDI